MNSMIIDSSLDNLDRVAEYIINVSNQNGIIILRGDLASGKTTLASEIASKLTGGEGAVSPTFSLQHVYKDKLFHYDLYRMDFEEVSSLGLLEEFDKDGLHLIEWANEQLTTLLAQAGYDVWRVDITPIEKGRRYEIQKLDS